MGAVFALAVAVQWNDPDPWMWMLLYAVAAAFSLAAAFEFYIPALTLAIASVYAVAALWTFPAVLEADLGAYTSFKMRSTDDEVARECIGLVLCAGWMFVVWWRGRASAVSR